MSKADVSHLVKAALISTLGTQEEIKNLDPLVPLALVSKIHQPFRTHFSAALALEI